MNCDRAAEHISDLLKGTLAAEIGDQLRRHLATCEACRDEAASLTDLWQRLGGLDDGVPSGRMRARFYSALAAYERDRVPTPGQRIRSAIEGFWPRTPVLQMGIAGLALLVGVVVGPQLAPAPVDDGAIDALRGELQAMNRTVTLSLMEHQSASERLRGIEWSLRGAQDATVQSALLNAVNFDNNVNVRLAAVEVLAGMADRPEVFSSLAEALPQQESSLMQVALAEVLLAVNRTESTPVVEQVLQNPNLEPSVRQRLQASLEGPI